MLNRDRPHPSDRVSPPPSFPSHSDLEHHSISTLKKLPNSLFPSPIFSETETPRHCYRSTSPLFADTPEFSYSDTLSLNKKNNTPHIKLNTFKHNWDPSLIKKNLATTTPTAYQIRQQRSQQALLMELSGTPTNNNSSFSNFHDSLSHNPPSAYDSMWDSLRNGGNTPTNSSVLKSKISFQNAVRSHRPSDIFTEEYFDACYKNKSPTAHTPNFATTPTTSKQPNMFKNNITHEVLPNFEMTPKSRTPLNNKYPFRREEDLKESSSTLSTLHLSSSHKQNNFQSNNTSKVRGIQQNTHNQRFRTQSHQQTKASAAPSSRIKYDDFLILKCMGQGKFGSVFLVRHKLTGFIAALKVIKKKQIIEGNLLGQLIRELKIQAFLNHPNIISFYGCFHDKDNIYILLELGCEGQLYEILKKRQSYSEEATSFIIKNLLQGMKHMHKNKLIHRDIKPENIVIVHGIVKICDFGWAVYRGNDLRRTFCGTPLYFSPELLKGESYGEEVDLWAIGILAYQLMVGRIPFNIKREEELSKIVTDDVLFPKEQDLSGEFQDFIMKILRKNPKERLGAAELLEHSFIVKYQGFQTCEQLCTTIRK